MLGLRGPPRGGGEAGELGNEGRPTEAAGGARVADLEHSRGACPPFGGTGPPSLGVRVCVWGGGPVWRTRAFRPPFRRRAPAGEGGVAALRALAEPPGASPRAYAALAARITSTKRSHAWDTGKTWGVRKTQKLVWLCFLVRLAALSALQAISQRPCAVPAVRARPLPWAKRAGPRVRLRAAAILCAGGILRNAVWNSVSRVVEEMYCARLRLPPAVAACLEPPCAVAVRACMQLDL
eukprot:109110-Chlamydomonas_euryale.AAC.1